VKITAVYAGSFDPVTLGHVDLIARASNIFDQVIVGIGVNSSKKPTFSTEERIQLIAAACSDLGHNIEVTAFEGLLVNFCKKVGASVIIRGLRAVTDFEYELGIAHANATQVPEIDTYFLPTKPEFSFVSASVVREIAKYGGDLHKYVPPVVSEALREKFKVPG
jgi:pantetheine-phosphate adenylyltransferase